MTRFGFIVMAIVLVLASPAAAEEGKAALDGYGDIKLGMSEAELKGMSAISLSREMEDPSFDGAKGNAYLGSRQRSMASHSKLRRSY